MCHLQCQPATHATCYRHCGHTNGSLCKQVGNDVVLRLEFIRDRQMKRALIGIWVVESLAFIALVAEVSLKLSKVRLCSGLLCVSSLQPQLPACMLECRRHKSCLMPATSAAATGGDAASIHAAAWCTHSISAVLLLLLRRSRVCSCMNSPIAMSSLKCLQTSEWFFRRRAVEKTNVFFATVCLVVLTISLGILSHRLALANASGKRWCVNTCCCGAVPQQTACRSHADQRACTYPNSRSHKHDLTSAMRTHRQEPPADSDGAEGRGRAHHRGAPASAMHCPQQRVAKAVARRVCAVSGRTVAIPNAVCTLQLVIVLSWFIANVYVVAGPCRWFDGFVIVNGALHVHAPLPAGGVQLAPCVACETPLHACISADPLEAAFFHICRDDTVVWLECHICAVPHVCARQQSLGHTHRCCS